MVTVIQERVGKYPILGEAIGDIEANLNDQDARSGQRWQLGKILSRDTEFATAMASALTRLE